MLSRELAADAFGSYRIVWIPEEFHLYVEFASVGSAAVEDWTIEDFINFNVDETRQRPGPA
ncbi:hypothetical protein AB4144_02390 [Rhizobiaceae sp. 2RAB30]